ncbi:MAG: PAS domain S-box protein [Blastochloris sp.]|nr:PAS domain S-box protein [Blastochloris sp.]
MLFERVHSNEQLLHLLNVMSDSIITIDAHQRIVLANHSALQGFGYAAEQLAGHSLDALLSPLSAGLVGQSIQRFAATAATGSAQPLAAGSSWRRSDGSTFPADIILVKLNVEEPMSVTLVVHDSSERQRAEADLHQAEVRYRALVDSVQDYAIFMLDPDGLVASWNTGAERITGYGSDEVVGQHFRCFFPPEAIAQQQPEHELHTATCQGRYGEEDWRIRKDGSRFWASVVLTAVQDEHGQVCGFSKVIRDISEQQQVAAALRHYTARLNMLYEISRAILTAQSPEAIAEATVRRIRHLVPCQYVSMVAYDDTAGAVQMLASEHDTVRQTPAEGLGYPSFLDDLMLLEQGHIGSIPDIERVLAAADIPPDWQATGLRSYLGVPLLARGARGVWYTRGDSCSANDAPIAARHILGRVVAIERDGICHPLRQHARRRRYQVLGVLAGLEAALHQLRRHRGHTPMPRLLAGLHGIFQRVLRGCFQRATQPLPEQPGSTS